MMTLAEAKNVIRSREDKWERLVEAAAIVTSSENASFEDLIVCLRHRGLPQEYGAMALYNRTDRDPPSIGSIVMDPDDWLEYLKARKLM